MPEWMTRTLSPASTRSLSKAIWLTLGVGGLLTATWLWCCWCSFPAFPWNDIRVAPAVALHHGISVYTTATTGPVSTWLYGPLPLLLLWPAGLASSAIGAIEIAGAIHIGLTVLTLTLICLFWPAASGVASTLPRRLAAALLCVLFVRNQTSGYQVYCADAPGLVFGLLSLLALAHQRYWLAALGAAAAAACKQTLIGVGVAQLVWLALAVSPRAAWQQLGRYLMAGTALAIPALYYFGGAGLWHTMIAIPGSFPWAQLPGRLTEHRLYLLIHVAIPVAIMLGARRFFFGRKSPALLPALAFSCTLPLSLAGFLKIGGNVNSLHSFWLWFPPLLAVLLTGELFVRLGQSGSLALTMLVVGVASLWLQTSRLSVAPSVQAYREAIYLAKRLPGKIWFPMHPLVTLYSDGRLYPDLDGLRERSFAGQAVTAEHFFTQMPRLRQASTTLLPVGWGLADIAEARLPANTPVTSFGQWRVDGRLD